MMSGKRSSVVSLAFILLLLAAFSFPLVLFAPPAKAALLYDSGDPTPEEQLVLEYINRARANPIAEGQRLGIDIHEGLSDPSLVGPRPPLAMNKILLSIAQAHSQNMYSQNYFSHTDPNGMTPFDRMTNAGYDYVLAGENMAAGVDLSATVLEDLMMVDAGNPGRPHRVNLLDLIEPYPCSNPPCAYSEVGIGYYQGSTPNGMGLDSLITEDFGAAVNSGPFLLGVVYNDLNGNNFYDIGEGIAGVTITTSSGGYYAISSSSGGYAVPVGTSGTITVTASGPGFGPITKTVTLTGANVKLDFVSGQASSTTSSSTQTSTTSTVTTTSSTLATTTSSQTTTTLVNVPSIALNHGSAPAGSIVDVYGFGFSSGDSACSLSGIALATWTCSISNGALAASFVVANVMLGSYGVTATGNPSGDSASTTLAVSTYTTQTTISTTTSSTSTILSSTSTSTTLTSTSSGTTEAGDFSLASSVPSLALTQGASGSATITLYSLNGFSSAVTLTASWVGSQPSGIAVSMASPITPPSGGAAVSPLTIATNTVASPGAFTLQVTATSGSLTHILTSGITVQVTQAVTFTTTSSTTANSTTISSTTTSPSLPPLQVNCALSSATAGTQLAPLAQALRTFRDQSIMKTRSGAAFMTLFNAWYYSFSPRLASSFGSHPVERSLFRYGLYPLISILYVSYYSYLLVSPLNAESAAITAGVVAAGLIGLVYFAPLLYLTARILRRRLTSSSLNPIFLVAWSAISLVVVVITYFNGAQLPLGIAEANLTLSSLTLLSTRGAMALARLVFLGPSLRTAIAARLWTIPSYMTRRLFEGSSRQTT
jgi:hypothetical protein